MATLHVNVASQERDTSPQMSSGVIRGNDRTLTGGLPNQWTPSSVIGLQPPCQAHECFSSEHVGQPSEATRHVDKRGLRFSIRFRDTHTRSISVGYPADRLDARADTHTPTLYRRGL